MQRELKIFLIAVGLPAVLLTAAAGRLVYIEWRRASFPLPRNVISCRGGDAAGRDSFPEWPPPRPPCFPKGVRMPLPPPPGFLGLFSEKCGMDGERVLLIGCCVLGLLFLSLVSGSWLLVKSAKRSRLDALRQTDFVSNISHEFKTPLTTICLCAELAREPDIDEDRRRRALTTITSESERLKRLLLNALDFSRLEQHRRTYDMRPLDLGELAREVCATFGERFSGRRLIEPGGTCPAVGDADAIRQILANLLDNVAKYAPEGAVEVRAESEAGVARLSVADRGPGLNRSDLRHVFDRFWRADNSVTRATGGSGLGLAIARELARGMGGDISVANRDGGGAVFTVELGT